LAQGGESFDFAQDREPVERLVEPFGICVFLFEIFYYWNPWPRANFERIGKIKHYWDLLQ
jgi:hypothetical protein